MAKEIRSSSSASTSTRSYHVFASFNGDDTRSTLIGHLFKALKEKGIRKFRDDEDLPRGEPISDELVKAIKTSRIAVIVFSKNYASSKWCLDELVEIMENKRSLHQIMPVFYDVDPADVREQKGSFAEALADHKKCVGEDKVKMWKAALTDAAHLPGLAWDSQTSGFEFEFIEEIVKEISQKLELPLDDSSRDAWSPRIHTRISRSIPNSRIVLSFFFFLSLGGLLISECLRSLFLFLSFFSTPHAATPTGNHNQKRKREKDLQVVEMHREIPLMDLLGAGSWTGLRSAST